MDFILKLGRDILTVPVWALIEAPFILAAVRVVNIAPVSFKIAPVSFKIAPVSFKEAAKLGLMTGAATLVISLVLYPLYWAVSRQAAQWIMLVVSLAAMVWLFGHFLRDTAGKSIGMSRGTVVFAVHLLMLFIVFVLVAAVVSLTGLAVS